MFLLLIYFIIKCDHRDISLLHQYIWADAGCGLKPESTSGHAHTSFTYINEFLFLSVEICLILFFKSFAAIVYKRDAIIKGYIKTV